MGPPVESDTAFGFSDCVQKTLGGLDRPEPGVGVPANRSGAGADRTNLDL
jgi:hypothetical protein